MRWLSTCFLLFQKYSSRELVYPIDGLKLSPVVNTFSGITPYLPTHAVILKCHNYNSSCKGLLLSSYVTDEKLYMQHETVVIHCFFALCLPILQFSKFNYFFRHCCRQICLLPVIVSNSSSGRKKTIWEEFWGEAESKVPFILDSVVGLGKMWIEKLFILLFVETGNEV